MTTPEALYPSMAWWTGIVEDRDDPLELGRLRVRIHGYHNTSDTVVPKEDLPWAHTIQPITSSTLAGEGRSPTGAKVGTHVIGFFADGAENCQEPIVWGSIGGLNVSTGEADTPRLSRSKGILDTETFEEVSGKEINKLDTILVDKLKNAIDDKKNDFKEPIPTYAGAYPTNHVWKTESGHALEVDDTQTAERLAAYHKTGTYIEIGPLGERIVKVVGTDTEMVVSNKILYIDGKFDTIVTGDETVTIRGDSTVIIDGNSKVTIGGNCDIIVNGNFTLTVDGNGSISCGGTLRLTGASVFVN